MGGVEEAEHRLGDGVGRQGRRRVFHAGEDAILNLRPEYGYGPGQGQGPVEGPVSRLGRPGGRHRGLKPPGDQHLHDFVGAPVDALYSSIRVHLGDGVFVHVARAAVKLKALVDDFALRIGAPVLGHGGRFRVELAFQVPEHAVVHEGARYPGLGFALGQLELGVLKVEHALAEGLALLDEVEGHLNGPFHGHHGGLSDIEPFLGQLLHEHEEALPFLFPNEVALGNAHVVEEQLRGAGTLPCKPIPMNTPKTRFVYQNKGIVWSKGNAVDSDRMADLLKDSHALTVTDAPDDAEVILINTCSIREKAQEKVFSELGRYKALKESNPNLIIGVGGCVASQEGDAIRQRAPFVDLVFGPQTLHRLPDMLEARRSGGEAQVDISFPEIEKFDRLPEPKLEGPSAYVSIMEGCSKYCTFCVVPYTRGEEISRPGHWFHPRDVWFTI